MGEKVKKNIFKNVVVCMAYLTVIILSIYVIKVDRITNILTIVAGLLMFYYFVRYKIAYDSDPEKAYIFFMKALDWLIVSSTGLLFNII